MSRVLSLPFVVPVACNGPRVLSLPFVVPVACNGPPQAQHAGAKKTDLGGFIREVCYGAAAHLRVNRKRNSGVPI